MRLASSAASEASTAAWEEYAVLHRALATAVGGEDGGERGGARRAGPRRAAALGDASASASASWLDFSGGLFESIKTHGVPGDSSRAGEPSKARGTTSAEEEEDEGAFARFRRRTGPSTTRTQTQTTHARRDAKERLAPTRAWFAAKPKQLPVYWDVDLEKIQRARESVSARAVEQGGTDFDFEITDMPIVPSKKTSPPVAALGSALDSNDDSNEEKTPDDASSRDEDATAAANATSVFDDDDDGFSEMLTQWTKKAVAHIDAAATKARQTASYVHEKAVAAEEELLMKHVDVKFYVDFADPLSLEALLGPYQHLSAKKLGPVRWTVVPFVNVGQAHNASVNCLYNGHARHLSCTANGIAACAEQSMRELPGAMRAFTSCYGVQMLKLESQEAFTFGRHEEALSDAQGQCCEAVTSALDALSTVNASATTTQTGNGMCQAQKECAKRGLGYDFLKQNAAELGSVEPRYKYLPWVTIDGVPACRHKCNLQASVRRKICALRTTLPEDCPKFPWAQAWYDEPEVSFGGLAAVTAAVIFVVVSAFVLMREAGLRPLGMFGDAKTAARGATNGESAGLLPK